MFSIHPALHSDDPTSKQIHTVSVLSARKFERERYQSLYETDSALRTAALQHPTAYRGRQTFVMIRCTKYLSTICAGECVETSGISQMHLMLGRYLLYHVMSTSKYIPGTRYQVPVLIPAVPYHRVCLSTVYAVLPARPFTPADYVPHGHCGRYVGLTSELVRSIFLVHTLYHAIPTPSWAISYLRRPRCRRLLRPPHAVLSRRG